ncbi:MAG: transporter substrate-binding domain-containing protein [Ruminococcaceae bacterium]|nr:transporter substrate-binding domain-containing protein [Oscillospiraceae bacterium]
MLYALKNFTLEEIIMKKILALAMAVVMLLCVVSCGSKQSNVKVYTEYELTAEKYAFAIAKENTALMTAANELLAELKANGELDKIINSFFDGTATFEYENPIPSAPTGADKANYLVVATNAYFPPFEYYNGSKLTGVDMKIASLLAEKLGKTLYINDMEFDSVITSVKNGESDIGMAGMTVNEERKKTIDFTTEYYESAQVLIVREDDKVFAECKSADDIIAKLGEQDKEFKVGTQNGTTGFMFSNGDEGFGYDGFKNLTTSGYTTGALAVLDLANGKVDAVIIDKQPAIMIAKSTNK